MSRILALLPLAPLLASCQPAEILVHAAFIGRELAFVAADPDDSDFDLCWREAAVLDDKLRPAWAFGGGGGGPCGRLLPLFYGRAPERTEASTPPRPLEDGRLYLVVGNAVAEVRGAFVLGRAGRGRTVRNVDPGSPAAAALRERWLRRGQAAAPPAD